MSIFAFVLLTFQCQVLSKIVLKLSSVENSNPLPRNSIILQTDFLHSSLLPSLHTCYSAIHHIVFNSLSCGRLCLLKQFHSIHCGVERPFITKCVLECSFSTLGTTLEQMEKEKGLERKGYLYRKRKEKPWDWEVCLRCYQTTSIKGKCLEHSVGT